MAKKCKDSTWDDIDLTRDEVERLGEALKKEEFRKLLLDYAEEINDPENKKQYEQEITELERERGVDVIFVNPEPCYVIKSSADGQKKAFINVCKNEKVGKPVSTPAMKAGNRGLNWSLPYAQAPPREDYDKNKNRCKVFDVVFHPETIHLAEKNAEFKKMLNNTALDAVEDNFNINLDRKNIKFPKLKYKGAPRPTVIRKKINNCTISKDEFSIPDSYYPYKPPEDEAEVQKRCDEAKKRREQKEKDNCDIPKTVYTTPVYIIKHRQSVDIQDFSNGKDSKMNATVPKELVIEIELPLLNSSSDMTLDVTNKSVLLVCEKPAKYKLDISLPYTVDEELGNAKFDKSLRQLVITLPVRKPNIVNLADIGREDSGVESDLGRRTPESSSDEDVPNQNSGVEIETKTVSLPEISSDEAYRTISKNFLNPNVQYLLPAFTCNVVGSVVAFTLHVKNVEPESVQHLFLGDNMNGVHVQFTSVGSGFFPIHYAFCLKFPADVSISEDSFNAEAWDSNVILEMQLNTGVVEYYAGLEEASVARYNLPEPAAMSRRLQQLELEAAENTLHTDVMVDVTSHSENQLILEVKTSTPLDEDDEDDEDSSAADDKPCSEQPQPETQRDFQKCRTMSESSADELSLSPTKKGILKNNGRMCRSLSESSAEDYGYGWSSSLDMMTYSGSESCIPEEAGEEERETKKTVRFNEVVSQKTYRTNSSILGQRKKNQRKTRNKRRSQERRASESENSEGEAEKERENKTEASIPTIEEGSEPGKQETQLSKNSSKGKRKNRKGAPAQVEFASDLIFDLDM